MFMHSYMLTLKCWISSFSWIWALNGFVPQGSSLNFGSNIKQIKCESINFYSPWNHEKTYGFLTILGGIELNSLTFAKHVFPFTTCGEITDIFLNFIERFPINIWNHLNSVKSNTGWVTQEYDTSYGH